MNKTSPTFLHVISTDYLAQNFFVMIFAGWVIVAIDAIFGGRAAFFLVTFAAILTPIGLVTFFSRYRLIASTFANGTEITGRVTEINTISSGGKSKDYLISYEYSLNGRIYHYRNRVKTNAFAKKLREGQRVNLLVHKKTPQTAFIKDFYLESL